MKIMRFYLSLPPMQTRLDIRLFEIQRMFICSGGVGENRRTAPWHYPQNRDAPGLRKAAGVDPGVYAQPEARRNDRPRRFGGRMWLRANWKTSGGNHVDRRGSARSCDLGHAGI